MASRDFERHLSDISRVLSASGAIEGGQPGAVADPAPSMDTATEDTEERIGWSSKYPIIVGSPTPAFEPKCIGSEYRTTPYRADTSLDGWSTDAFTVRAASVRGHLHRYNGAPRQDDFAIASRREGKQVIVAIADGVSSAGQSHVGATTAVRYATQWLHARVAEPVRDTDWKALIESTAWALVEQASALLSVDEIDAEQAEKLVATTLVCAVADRSCSGEAVIHVVGIGDSGAWLFGENTFEAIDGGKVVSSSGISTSAVAGLPRVPAEIIATSFSLPSTQVLLLGTDGFGDPLGSGRGNVGRLFAELLGDGVPSMIEFAHFLDFSRETFDDDRTLVAVWPRMTQGIPTHGD